MVERDGRYDAERGTRDDVGGVQAPAEADFQDHRVGGTLGKGEKGGGRGDLEEGDLLAGVDALHFGQPVDELGLADGARAPSAPPSSMRSWKRTRCGEV